MHGQQNIKNNKNLLPFASDWFSVFPPSSSTDNTVAFLTRILHTELAKYE